MQLGIALPLMASSSTRKIQLLQSIKCEGPDLVPIPVVASKAEIETMIEKNEWVLDKGTDGVRDSQHHR